MSIDRLDAEVRRECAQPLKVDKEKCLVLDERAAEGEAGDFLDELGLPKTLFLAGRVIGIESWSLIEKVGRTVIVVGPGTSDHLHLRTAVASVFGREVTGYDAKFREHVGIRAQGREVGASGAGFIDVDTIERVVPGTIAGSVGMDTSARNVRASLIEATRIHDAGFEFDQRESIAAPAGYDGQGIQSGVINKVADVAGGRSLNQLGGCIHDHGFRDRTHLEGRRESSGLTDGDHVPSRGKCLETRLRDLHCVSPRLHRVEHIRAGRRRLASEGNSCCLVCQGHLGVDKDRPARITHHAGNSGGGLRCRQHC